MTAMTTTPPRQDGQRRAQPHADATTTLPTSNPARNWPSLVAQAVTIASGVLFAVMGAVALARAGIPADGSLTDGHVVVGWLHHTPLLAVGHLLAGAGLLSTGWYAALDRRPSFLGLLGVIVGLVVWVEPGALHGSLGVHRAHAVTYLLLGVAHLASGIAAGWRHQSGTEQPTDEPARPSWTRTRHLPARSSHDG